MNAKLEQCYKMSNGRYDIRQIIADENSDLDNQDILFASLFGGNDEQNPDGESELVTLARKLNREMAQAEAESKRAKAAETLGKTKLAGADWFELIELGYAQIGGGAETLHYRLTSAGEQLLEIFQPDPYADQVGLEERGG